jgi:AcrR family transcriptional regulator
MLVAAAELLRERGAAGVTIDAVLSRSGAPRGSVYHHFPGGRSEILSSALRFAGDEILAGIGAGTDVSAVTLLRRLAAMWRSTLADSDFTAGSPVLAAAVGSGADEQQLTSVAAEIFRRWREASRQAYEREGFDPDESTALAHMTISAFEGAVVLCRATRSTQPIDDVAREMEFLIKARAFVRRATAPGNKPGQ